MNPIQQAVQAIRAHHANQSVYPPPNLPANQQPLYQQPATHSAPPPTHQQGYQQASQPSTAYRTNTLIDILNHEFIGSTESSSLISGIIHDQHKFMIHRVADNTARQDTVELFETLIKDNVEFRQLVAIYQHVFESLPSQRAKADRLRIALRQVLVENGRLPPRGSALIQGDAPPHRVHTPPIKRHDQAQCFLVRNEDFMRSPEGVEFRHEFRQAKGAQWRAYRQKSLAEFGGGGDGQGERGRGRGDRGGRGGRGGGGERREREGGLWDGGRGYWEGRGEAGGDSTGEVPGRGQAGGGSALGCAANRMRTAQSEGAAKADAFRATAAAPRAPRGNIFQEAALAGCAAQADESRATAGAASGGPQLLPTLARATAKTRKRKTLNALAVGPGVQKVCSSVTAAQTPSGRQRGVASPHLQAAARNDQEARSQNEMA